MSFEFSQAKQYNPEERAQIILVWMVLIEFIRIRDGNSTWEIKKSADQLVRLIWIIFLVFSYSSHGLVLFVLCAVSFVNEVLKGIAVHKAKNSYLIGRNPKLIHNYMKRVMLHHDMRTTPMNKCDYIVMGEENHDISVCDDGYRLGDKKSNSVGKLTIGRVFQLNSSEDEVFTMAHPDWRDKCLSIALAKMLRRRFVKLPLDEDGNSKALEFVLEGLIDYVGSNEDIPIERRDQEQNPIERVFDIIQDELSYVSGFSNPRASPTLFNTDVKEAILRSLRKSGGQITNGETALRSHEVLENVNQVCRPSRSTTEAILIWHIATTLFHYQKPLPQSNNNAFKKEGHVTLALSTYCYYLVASLPQLLPDEVEWTKKTYESAREEIFIIDRSSRRKPTIKNRCSYLMGDVLLDEKSVVDKGAKLAQMLVFYADNGKEVWTMLSEFWAEMLLFIAPSDNVKGHEEILEKGELITQLWALLSMLEYLLGPNPHSLPIVEARVMSEGNATNEVVTDIQYPNHASEEQSVLSFITVSNPNLVPTGTKFLYPSKASINIIKY
ncbi:hypothetical protein LUZ61_019263 [Rhynchospora tenuis]|uniref:DUF4220 domain-containing protein n=1 Tax=Rhynchospora tenuis TaxID=198213 RepID=A0AAD5ZAT2_9POAL|nr:hypothetical protein LUZ61_019263 [Rhynchospora tenuis]